MRSGINGKRQTKRCLISLVLMKLQKWLVNTIRQLIMRFIDFKSFKQTTKFKEQLGDRGTPFTSTPVKILRREFKQTSFQQGPVSAGLSLLETGAPPAPLSVNRITMTDSVADKVEIHTKSYKKTAKPVKWECDGS